MTRKTGTFVYYSMWVVVAIAFLQANKVPKPAYTPYQMLVWEIKANESYRPWWYPDGRTKTGKQKYSIGFGWNDLGGVRRKDIAKYTADGKVTFAEALEITLSEVNKWGKFNSDPYRNLAMQIHSYNCGRIMSYKELGHCHRGQNVDGKRCGSSNPRVRRAHNIRREYELALWRHDWVKIEEITEMNRAKVTSMLIKLKGH